MPSRLTGILGDFTGRQTLARPGSPTDSETCRPALPTPICYRSFVGRPVGHLQILAHLQVERHEHPDALVLDHHQVLKTPGHLPQLRRRQLAQ
jgi:hypothetical protein